MQIKITIPTFSLQPTIQIIDGLSEGTIVDTRWVQLLSLLAFKRLKGIDDGLVSLQELKRSKAFRSISPENIARSLNTSIRRQGFLPTIFVRNHVSLPTSGPFQLILSFVSINATLLPLSAYIQSIFGLSSSKTQQIEPIIRSLRVSLDAFELRSANYFLSGFLLDDDLPDHYPEFLHAMANLNLATTEYLMKGNQPHIQTLLAQAKNQADSIHGKNERLLIQLHYFGRKLWMTPMDKYSSLKTIRMNNLAIDLADQLPKKSSERLALLASRHYHAVYSALRFGTRSDAKRELKIVYELHEELKNRLPPKFIPYEPGSLQVINLQVALIRRMTAKENVTGEEIAQYDGCLKNPGISALNTLSAAEWIASSLFGSGQHYRAFDFLTEAVITHAPLHQTLLYTRVKRMRDSLGRILNAEK